MKQLNKVNTTNSIKTITLEDSAMIKFYNLSQDDVVSWLRSGRTIPMFIKNRLRAYARTLVINDLGLIQDEFVGYTTASERASLIHEKMDDLMSKGITKSRKVKKMSDTERALRRSWNQARVRNAGETITKETTRSFHKISIQEREAGVKQYLALNGEATHCALTGTPFNDNNPLMRASLDHIVPISEGGSHSAGNIRFVLAFVNMGQGKHSDEMFFEALRAIKGEK